jgi:hypothetical protein
MRPVRNRHRHLPNVERLIDEVKHSLSSDVRVLAAHKDA